MRISRRSIHVLVALVVLLCINNGVFIGFFRAAKTSVRLERNCPESSSTANTDLAPDSRDVQARSANVTASSNGNVSGDVNRTGGPMPSGGVSKGLDPVGGAGWPMEAWGQVVKPRANVTAPWSRDNTSTLCPLVPPNLVGRLGVRLHAPNLTEIVRLNPGLEPGGHYHPAHCRARHRVAVVVPYRDRQQHLRVLLHNLHPMLMRQQLDYFILVVELAQPTTFNRGMLLNIGAVEALGLWDVQCFIFHDVDMIPEDDRNLYTCPEMPRHMSAAVNKWNYKLLWPFIFGGVSAMNKQHFSQVNGYPNKYFGWGGEDDDMSSRIRHQKGLNFTRAAIEVARYRMIKHRMDTKNEVNPNRFDLLRHWNQNQKTDGLNSLQYEVKALEFRDGFTWILVAIDQEKVLKG